MKEQRLGWCPVATSSTRSLQRSITRRFLHTLTPKSLLWAPHEPIPSSAAQRQPLSPGIPWYPQGNALAAPYSPPQEAPLTHKLLRLWHSCFQTGESLSLHPSPAAPHASSPLDHKLPLLSSCKSNFPFNFHQDQWNPSTLKTDSSHSPGFSQVKELVLKFSSQWFLLKIQQLSHICIC